MTRWLLSTALCLVVAGVAPHARACPDSRVLWVLNVHTKEEARVRPFRRGGRLDALAWRRVNRLFRSWRTNRRRTMHPRLLRTLAHIQAHFGGRRLELVSGYRVPEDPDALSSFHQVGRAADVRLRGVDKRALFEFCRTLPRLGCGFYPNTSFVHIDVRSRAGIWVDLSAARTAKRYVPDARRWLKRNPWRSSDDSMVR